jgi:hypothetical protein
MAASILRVHKLRNKPIPFYKSIPTLPRRTLRDITCHTCNNNDKGFCQKHKQWCYAVRKTCDTQKKRK